MISGDNPFKVTPTWNLGPLTMETVESLEILGVTYSSKPTNYTTHVNTRANKCRQAFFSLKDAGIMDKSLNPQTKAYLWNTVCSPTLLYGMECSHLKKNDLLALDSLQGYCIKLCFNLGKRSHHSRLVQALGLKRASDQISHNSISLLHRIGQTDTRARDLVTFMLSDYIVHGRCVPGTLISRVLDAGVSPTNVLFNRYVPITPQSEDGVIDSIRLIMSSDNFTKSFGTDEQTMLRLITRSF